MVTRDPQTGQFRSGESFDDVEVVSFKAAVGIPAADLGGAAAFAGGSDAVFEGVPLIDYDDVVDRNESLVLLSGHHALVVYENSTSTADGSVRAMVEVSASPSRQVAGALGGQSDVADEAGGVDLLHRSQSDTIDVLGRPMTAVGQAPFSDGTTGVGGGGSAGEDSVDLEGADLPREVAEFHPRDELFLNGSFDVWNTDDTGVHADVVGQHVYGVVSD